MPKAGHSKGSNNNNNNKNNNHFSNNTIHYNTNTKTTAGNKHIFIITISMNHKFAHLIFCACVIVATHLFTSKLKDIENWPFHCGTRHG